MRSQILALESHYLLHYVEFITRCKASCHAEHLKLHYILRLFRPPADFLNYLNVSWDTQLSMNNINNLIILNTYIPTIYHDAKCKTICRANCLVPCNLAMYLYIQHVFVQPSPQWRLRLFGPTARPQPQLNLRDGPINNSMNVNISKHTRTRTCIIYNVHTQTRTHIYI